MMRALALSAVVVAGCTPGGRALRDAGADASAVDSSTVPPLPGECNTGALTVSLSGFIAANDGLGWQFMGLRAVTAHDALPDGTFRLELEDAWGNLTYRVGDHGLLPVAVGETLDVFMGRVAPPWEDSWVVLRRSTGELVVVIWDANSTWLPYFDEAEISHREGDCPPPEAGPAMLMLTVSGSSDVVTVAPGAELPLAGGLLAGNDSASRYEVGAPGPIVAGFVLAP